MFSNLKLSTSTAGSVVSWLFVPTLVGLYFITEWQMFAVISIVGNVLVSCALSMCIFGMLLARRQISNAFEITHPRDITAKIQQILDDQTHDKMRKAIHRDLRNPKTLVSILIQLFQVGFWIYYGQYTVVAAVGIMYLTVAGLFYVAFKYFADVKEFDTYVRWLKNVYSDWEKDELNSSTQDIKS